MLFDLILLQAAEGGQQGNPIYTFVMIGGIIVVFYFFMIRPQQKKQKEERKFRESLNKGDRVITIGGLYGRIASVEENTLLLEVDNGVKLKFDKSAIKPAPEPGTEQKN